jgi:hypothetical protein
MLYKIENSEMEIDMADLDRIQDDLGFIRSTVDGASRHQVASLYFLWAAISLVGFILMDLNPARVGQYWMIAGPSGFALSSYLGWRDQRRSGVMNLGEGLRYMQHWGSMMVVIFLAVLLVIRGVMPGDALGPVILLILALSHFHAGVHLDPPLRWVGLLLVVGFFLVLSIDSYEWSIVGLAVAAAMTVAGILESRRRGIAS